MSIIMKFCWCTLSVNNLEESLKFYQEIVGLSVNRRFKAGPDSEIVFLGNGETEVELMSHGAGRTIDMGKDISLGFQVESVEKMMELVKEKGVKIHSGPFQPNPHVKFFFVTDPDGLRIQFVENI